MKKYTWYVEPDSFTNESIANFLASEGLANESVCQIVTDDGKLRHVWQVPYRIITKLKNSKKSFPFNFFVFVQEGKGKPRLYKLHEKKRISAQAKEVLRNIQEKKRRVEP